MKRLGELVRRALQWMLLHPLGRSQWIALGACALVLAAGIVSFGDQIARTTNLDSEQFDQGAYLRVAERNRPILWPAATDGIRNPLFPWLLARSTSGDTAAMFTAGQRLNVRCAAVLLLAFGVWAGLRLGWLPAVTFLVLATGILLPISTYVGTEVLFYGLFFAAWMQALSLLKRPTLGRWAVFGATLGLAYLAKPGVTLLVGSFAVAAAIRWFLAWRRDEPAEWRGARPWLGAGLAAVIFGPLIAPRAVDSWRQFGDPLQNTAMQCFWEENWEACYPKLGYLNPKLIGRIPPEDRPSPGRYFARNGWGGAAERLARGMRGQLENVFSVDARNVWFDRSPSVKRPVRRIFPYRGFFLLVPAALALAFAGVAWRKPGVLAVPESAWVQGIFAALLVGGSFGAFSWYYAIAPGARFILALYLPVLGSLLLAAEALRRRLGAPWADAAAGGAWLAMLGIVAAHFALIATHPYFDKLKGAF